MDIVIVAVIVHVIVGVHAKPCCSRIHGRASSWLSKYAPSILSGCATSAWRAYNSRLT
jgi:hypothetical protein